MTRGFDYIPREELDAGHDAWVERQEKAMTTTSPRRPGGAEAMREAAAKAATSFLVGDPGNGTPLRSPMPHEIADRIRSLPLPAGDTLSGGGEDARQQALEEAARVADAEEISCRETLANRRTEMEHVSWAAAANTARLLAKAIRSLKGQETDSKVEG